MKIILGVILFYCAVVSDGINIKPNGFNAPTVIIDGQERPPNNWERISIFEEKTPVVPMKLQQQPIAHPHPQRQQQSQFSHSSSRQSSVPQQQGERQRNNEIVHPMSSSNPQITTVTLQRGQEPATFVYKQHDTYHILPQDEQQVLSVILGNMQQRQQPQQHHRQQQQQQRPPQGTTGQQEYFQLGTSTHQQQEMDSPQVRYFVQQSPRRQQQIQHQQPGRTQQQFPINNQQQYIPQQQQQGTQQQQQQPQTQQTQQTQSPATGQQGSVDGFVPLLPDFNQIEGMYNFTAYCTVCCIPDEMPCRECCGGSPFLSATALKVAAG